MEMKDFDMKEQFQTDFEIGTTKIENKIFTKKNKSCFKRENCEKFFFLFH